MINFLLNNYDETWEFEGLKVIITDDPNSFHVDILRAIWENRFNIKINDKNIGLNKIIHISQYTKLKDLLNFNRSNKFLDYVLENVKLDEKINPDDFSIIAEKINKQINANFLDIKIDKPKLISYLFALNDSLFINKKDFLFYLNTNKKVDEKITLIINCPSWLTIDDLKDNVQYFNFIVICDSIGSFIKNSSLKSFDGVFVNFHNGHFNDLIDFERISDYISNQIGMPISVDNMIEILKKNDEKSEKIFKILKNI